MATYLENLTTYRDNLAAMLATWSAGGAGLKEKTIRSPVGTSVEFRTMKELREEIEAVDAKLASASPDVVYSRGI